MEYTRESIGDLLKTTLLEQAIYLKFPKIKGLNISKKEESLYIVSFEDNGYCLKKEVEDYLEEMKINSANFKINKNQS